VSYFLPISPSLLPDYLFLLQRTTHAMQIAKTLQRLTGALAEHRNMVMGVVAVEGLRTIPYEQHSHKLECVVARDTLRDIKERLEEVMTEETRTEVVMAEVLPITVGMVNMVVDMQAETSDKLTETDLDGT
jgi:hypothetical protein